MKYVYTVNFAKKKIRIIKFVKYFSVEGLNLGNAILEYSMDYYSEYELYSHAPNRRQHIPCIFKALIM